MDKTALENHCLSCPGCGGKLIYRSKRRGAKEWLLHYMRIQSPYRCGECDLRFFRFNLIYHQSGELHHRNN